MAEYDELISEYGFDPVTAGIFRRLIPTPPTPPTPPAVGEPAGSSSWLNLSNILDYLLNIRRTPEGITVKPGKIPYAMKDISEKTLTAPVKASRAVKGVVEEALSRLELTPEGLQIRLGEQPTVPTTQAPPSETRFMRRWRPVEPTEEPTTPAVTPEPTIPAPGETLGLAQYAAPPTLPAEPAEPTTPPVTAPTVPAEAAPPPEVPDFSKLVKPWKPSTDFEKELMNIFNESIKDFAELPKSKFKEPETLGEFFSDFVKYANIAFAGKDPWEHKLGEKARADVEAKEERNYAIQRATTLANLRISSLTEKMKREDTERANRSQYLQTLGTMYPGIRKQLSYQAALASVAGIPVEDAEAFLQKHIDPKTGLLESFYQDPTDIAIEHERKIQDSKIKALMDLNYSRDQAAIIALTGKYDHGEFLMSKYFRAQTTGDQAGMARALKDIKQWKEISTSDPDHERAVNILKNLEDPAFRKALRTVFADDVAYNSFIQHNTAKALGAKGWTPPTPKEMKPDDQVALVAMGSLGNPGKEKAFRDKYGISAQDAVKTYMKWGKEYALADPNTPEPLYSYGLLFRDADPKKFGDMILSPDVKRVVNSMITTKYAAEFAKINIKLPKNKQLTETEIHELATLFNRNDLDGILNRLGQVYADRKMKPPTK